MTFKYKLLGRRPGRHGAHHDVIDLETGRWDRAAARRTVLAHASQEWNSLRHAV